MKLIPKCETLKPFHLLALLLPFLATGCGQQEASYYPLAPGLSWEYELSVKRMLGGGQATMTLTNLQSRKLGDRDVVPQKMEVPGHSAFSFVAQDSTGVYEHARQEDGEPEIKKTPDYLLKYPVQVGISWKDAYKTEMLQQKIPVTIKSTIESVTETVTVPAGTFNNCVKVRGVGKAQKSMGIFGAAQIDVEGTTWVCPGIGVVKSSLEEDGHNLLLGGGKMSMQLAAMRQDGKTIPAAQKTGFGFPNWFGGQATTAAAASPSVEDAGIKKYLDGLFDRVFFPDGMKYTLTGLGTLGGKGSATYAVSADGAVVVGGSSLSDGTERAFRWKGGVMTDLGTLGGKQSHATAVSADGAVVVGRSGLSDGSSRAFRWKGGVMTDLGTLGGGFISQATAVSADGAVVVGSVQIGDGIGRAFRWHGGIMTDLGTLGGASSEATAVSADGAVVVGKSSLSDGTERAFRWKDGVMTDLGALGGKQGYATAVSADGAVVVGKSSLSDGTERAFRWKDGVMTDLGALSRKQGYATGVSADGAVVVGKSSLSDGTERAFCWKDGVMTDLGTLGYATDVSANGEVMVGTGFYPDGTMVETDEASEVSFPHAFHWKDGVMSVLGTLGGKQSYASGVSADGEVVVGTSSNEGDNSEAFIATAPQVAGLPASTARMVYYAVLAAIALGLVAVLSMAVRHASRGQRAHRPTPAGTAQTYCSQCGTAQPPGATFCAKCGARLEK